MYRQAAASFVFVTFLALSGISQGSWNRYAWGTPQREGFTVLLPLMPSQINKENGEQGISALEDEPFRDSTVTPLKNNLVFSATFKDGVGHEEYKRQVEKWMNLVGPDDAGSGTGTGKSEREKEIDLNRNSREVSVCGFPGVEFGNSNSVQQFFLIDGRLYHVWVTGANKSNRDVTRFLESFTLISPWEPWKGLRTNEAFGDSRFDKNMGVAFGSSVVCKNVGKSETKESLANLPRDSPLRLISKSQPKYPDDAKRKGIQGTVSLRVTFLKDGLIGEITVVKGINKEMDENAINAAKLIKFEPLRKAGKFITTTKIITYNFAIF